MPHHQPRRLLLVFLVLAPALCLLAACSDSKSRPGLAAAAVGLREPAAPVTVTWSFWGDAWEVDVNRRLVSAFQREHPGIKVETQHRPWNEYFIWLRSEWRQGRSPDVMFLNSIPSYAALGELEPLDGYVQHDGLDLADFYPALLDSFRAQGRLYGLPRDNDTKVIFYNRAMFAEAGLPEPAAGWTWEDLRRAALALTQRQWPSPRYGFGFEPAYWWLVWMWQGGCDVLDDPLRPTSSLLAEPACARSLQFLRDLIYTDRVTPPPAQLNTDDMSRLFREGRLAMVFGNHTLVPPFTETAGLSWDVAPLPRDSARVNVAGGAGFVMSRRAANKDAAWELIKYLTGPKAQAILAESGVITPARRSVREDNIFLRQQPYHADIFLAETELGRPVPNFPGVTEFNSLMDTALTAVWRGERPVADALADVGPKVQQIIEGQGAGSR